MSVCSCGQHPHTSWCASQSAPPRTPRRDPRRAYRVVDLFEQELADYTGAPFAIAVNSCTNALFLALMWERRQRNEATGVVDGWTFATQNDPIRLPRCTYVGVLQSVRNAGFEVEWNDLHDDWQQRNNRYRLFPTNVIDCARCLFRLMGKMDSYAVHGYMGKPRNPFFVCLSFHAAKQLPLGRGGAILTDNEEAAEWFRAARMDGRPPGKPFSATVFPSWHMPMPPDVAARGLDVLSRWNDAGWSPPPLPATDYPDLSLIHRPKPSVPAPGPEREVARFHV